MSTPPSTEPAAPAAYRKRGSGLGGRVLARQLTRPVVVRYGLDHRRELTLADSGDWEVSDPATGKVIGYETPRRFERLYEPINE